MLSTSNLTSDDEPRTIFPLNSSLIIKHKSLIKSTEYKQEINSSKTCVHSLTLAWDLELKVNKSKIISFRLFFFHPFSYVGLFTDSTFAIIFSITHVVKRNTVQCLAHYSVFLAPQSSLIFFPRVFLEFPIEMNRGTKTEADWTIFMLSVFTAHRINNFTQLVHKFWGSINTWMKSPEEPNIYGTLAPASLIQKTEIHLRFEADSTRIVTTDYMSDHFGTKIFSFCV